MSGCPHLKQVSIEGGYECRRCGAFIPLARRPLGYWEDGRAPLVVPDEPEHFNLSLGKPIRSRRHRRALQDELGVRPVEGWRPTSDDPEERVQEVRAHAREVDERMRKEWRETVAQAPSLAEVDAAERAVKVRE